jgi:hypothetical protein
MMNPALRPDASLVEYLVARARAASDGRLVLDALGGLLLALTIAVWRPVAWPSFAGVCLALAAFGFWGIADRELRDRAGAARSFTTRALGVARGAVAAIGFLSAALALFSGLGIMLGTWIS